MEKTWQSELTTEAATRVATLYPQFTSVEVKDIREIKPGNMFISIIADGKVFTGAGNSINSTCDALIRNIDATLNSPDKQYYQLQENE